MTNTKAWADQLVDWAAQASDRRDGTDPDSLPGPVAKWFGMVKVVVSTLLSPLMLVVLALRVRVNASRAVRDAAGLATGLLRSEPVMPGHAGQRIAHLDGRRRILFTSDLHRGPPGGADLPAAMGTKELYAEVIGGYHLAGWSLVENGDADDFWYVGGSTWGVAYEVLRNLAGALGPFGRSLRRRVYAEHLNRIVANNAAAYEVIAALAREDRYARTVGNHDDVMSDPDLVAALCRLAPGSMVASTLVLDGPDGVVWGVVAHGHGTDGWNAPGRSILGKYMMWLANAFDDAPGVPGVAPQPSAEETTIALLEGRVRNHLMDVDRGWSTNRRFDSMSELLLAENAPGFGSPDSTRQPWVLLGHTHVPKLDPADDEGKVWYRYANSGSGVLPGAMTAIEWDGTGDEPVVRLVLWRFDPDAGGLEGHVLEPGPDHRLIARPHYAASPSQA